MIRVNELIHNAAQRVGIIGDGEPLGASQASAALSDLRAVISDLNTEDYILENCETIDIQASRRVRLAVKPTNWYELSNKATLLSKISTGELSYGDIVKLTTPDTYQFYCVRYDAHGALAADSNPVFEQDMKDKWPNYFLDVLPDRVIGCARRVSDRYIQLIPVNRMTLDTSSRGSLPTAYSTETEVLTVDFPHADTEPYYKPYTMEYFVLDFNTNTTVDYRLTILKGIPQFTISDAIPFSSKYISLLEAGLCVRLCERYKYIELYDTFSNNFESTKTAIKRINSSNRPMTYDFTSSYSNYSNFLGGIGW